MTETASDFLIKRLHEWGVRRIYGYPGDGINAIMGALDRHQDKITFIQTRHEEEAAFMATAHAKFTGEVGVCLATSGPGPIHLLNGLYDARLDSAPVLAIVGQQASTAIGTDYQQEVDLVSLFKDVAHSFVHMASTPSPPRSHGVCFTGVGYARPRIVAEKSELEHAARVLNEGNKVAMLVGAGALNATDQVIATAELLGAGIAKALLGKAAVPDDLPFVTGSIGLLGTEPTADMMADCDTLLVVGSSFSYSEFYPKEGQARGVQIDLKARNLSGRYPMEVNLHGDSAATLEALMPLLKKKDDRSWRASIEKSVHRWWGIMDTRARMKADPINPQLLFTELSPRLPDRCIITCDSGSAANWYARDLKIRRGMMASLSGGLATMCPGVPYATAAKFCHPNRVVIAAVGDGAMQMLGNAGLITIAKYWQTWSDPRLIGLVLRNNDRNQVTWEQRVMSGDPKFAASQDIPDFPYARCAEMVGLGGIRLSDPAEIGAAWDHALSADRPMVIDACCDPDVPPLPPHITFDQAKRFMFSLFKEDPDRKSIIKQSAKQMISSFLGRDT